MISTVVFKTLNNEPIVCFIPNPDLNVIIYTLYNRVLDRVNNMTDTVYKT